MDIELKGTWAEQLTIQCGDYLEHSENIIFCLYLDAEDVLQAIIAMKDNGEKILRQINKSVCHGSFDADSVNLSALMLEMTAGVIQAISRSFSVK